jgi:molecular chaperone DnaK
VQKTGNSADIKKAMDELNEVWSQASTKMYQQATEEQQKQAQQQQESQTPPGGGEKKDKDSVIDADFEVVDDKDKK